MTDPISAYPVRVTAEERPHPAIQKLARACIALARLRLAEEVKPAPTKAQHADCEPPQSDEAGGEVCHG